MVQVSEIELEFSADDEEESNITYQKSKNFKSEGDCLAQAMSERLDKLSIKKPIPCKNMCQSEVIKEHYVGLVNQAMTCYLNSLLQAFYMTPEFRNALYNWKYEQSEKSGEASVPFQIQKLFLNLQTSEKPSVETNSLTESFGWNSTEAWQQEDIQEFCRVIFDSLEKNFKNTLQANLVNQLYEGKISDTVKCMNCYTEKSREDTFLNIPLSVRSYDETYGSVQEALNDFVKCETLEGNNQYFCHMCQKKTNAQKGLKFTQFPYILMLQLKRFYFNQNTSSRIKLNDRVTFPEILNLDSFIDSSSPRKSPSLEEDVGLCFKCNDSCVTDTSAVDDEFLPSNVTDSTNNHLINNDDLEDEGIVMGNDVLSSSSSLNQNHKKGQQKYVYELFCIMIHSGSAKSGHYYAYIKDFRTGEWLCFNDQKVSSINIGDIEKSYGKKSKSPYCGRSTNAYMLMYRQIDPERNCLPMKEEDFPAHIKELLEKMKNDENSVANKHQQSPKTTLVDTAEEVESKKAKPKKAVKSDASVQKPKGKKIVNKKAVEVDSVLLEKISSNLATKKSQTKSQKIGVKKTVKKARDNDSESASEVSRLPKRMTRKPKLHISSQNPQPLRRSAFLLRKQRKSFYSFDSDDSAKSVKN